MHPWVSGSSGPMSAQIDAQSRSRAEAGAFGVRSGLNSGFGAGVGSGCGLGTASARAAVGNRRIRGFPGQRAASGRVCFMAKSRQGSGPLRKQALRNRPCDGTIRAASCRNVECCSPVTEPNGQRRCRARQRRATGLARRGYRRCLPRPLRQLPPGHRVRSEAPARRRRAPIHASSRSASDAERRCSSIRPRSFPACGR